MKMMKIKWNSMKILLVERVLLMHKCSSIIIIKKGKRYIKRVKNQNKQIKLSLYRRGVEKIILSEMRKWVKVVSALT